MDGEAVASTANGGGSGPEGAMGGGGGSKASMLQRILSEMYVEPELLEELDEEQKAILFCKMREEQLRRWAVADEEWEASLRRDGPRPRSSRRIAWLEDSQGRPWTWVMGEHQDDPTIDHLIDQDLHAQAESQAEAELRRQAGLPSKSRQEEEEELKAALRDDPIHIPTPDYELSPVPGASATASALRPSTPKPSSSSPPDPDSEEGDDASVRDEYAALMAKLREAKLTVRRQGEREEEEGALRRELAQERDALATRLRAEAERRIEAEKDRRASEIYTHLKEAAAATQAEAEAESEDQRLWWRLQETKARKAEEEIRQLAKKARETLRELGGSLPYALPNVSSPSSSSVNSTPPRSGQSQLVGNLSSQSLPDSPTGSSSSSSKRRVAKPASREAIVDWFRREEAPRGTGRDPKTQLVAPWFHGFLGREEAKSLLRGRAFGAFLVRVSERIWGFTLSFCLGRSDVKHFLIERVEGGYQFMGTAQMVHRQLYDLVSYHESVPITAEGREVLAEPVGQRPGFPPDYQLLFGAGPKAPSSPSPRVLFASLLP